MIGETIAHYRITAKLGEGGMGEVYRAIDTKLNREVAVKVLPEAFAADAARMQRFEREAQVLASLNHPNIAAIYGIEQGAIVMELVEGDDLKGPVPVETALAYARQIATALEAAHEKGIIHRDLKPANIKITPDGVVKLLDFGLAKAAEERATSAAASPTMSPTLSLAMTQAGMILGTAAYMSPEQARGKPVDKRADIWAFGVVLFEMLTGRHLYGGGETVTDTLAAVITSDPDWTVLPPETPANVRRLLERCLRKNPKLRLRDIGEARILLDEPASAAPAIAHPRAVLPWAIAGVMTLAAAGAGVLAWWEARPTGRPLMRLDVDLGPAAVSNPRRAPALSPDGSRMVFPVRGADGREQLAMRLFDQPKSTTIPGTEGGTSPFFSPDGQWLAFFADRKLKKVSLTGGAPVTLCDTPNPRGGSWGEDGNIVFVPSVGGTGLWRISASGGAPQAMTKPADQGQFSHFWPQSLGGGKSVLFSARRSAVSGSDEAEIALLTVATGKWKTLRGGNFGRYLPSGHLVYVQNGALFGLRFNPDRGEAEGTPVQLLDDVAGNTITAAGNFDFARTGTFAYASGKPLTNQYQVAWLDTSGKAQPLLTTPRQYTTPALSPDGDWLAVGVGNLLASEVYIFDLRRETLTQLTFSAQRARDPVWAPDGIHLVYATLADGNAAGTMWWTRRDGGGQPHKLLEASRQISPGSISPDGRRLAYSQAGDLWILPLEKTAGENPRPGKPERFFESPRTEAGPAFSPDGRWLAYHADDSGRMEVYVRPYPGPGGKSVISAGEGQWPAWSHDGRQIFYATADGQIMIVECQVKGDSILAGKPRIWATRVATLGLSRYAVARDGKRVAVAAPLADELPDPKASLHVMFLLNFFDEVTRRVQ